jgi:S1-C subfamily serine protease
LTDRQGRLAGMLGKELRNSLDNTWLNFAVPISQLASSVDDMLAGRNPPRRTDETARKPANAQTLVALGIVLVPDVLAKTPPFVDSLRPHTPAQAAGLRPDDLILFVNDRMVSSCKELVEELSGLPQHSFLFFGQRGTLDYAFASPALAQSARRAFIWHVNADWPGGMALSQPWLRMSDHDPVIVDLEFSQAATSD